MTKKLSIISEYNPFHFGHLYQLNQTTSTQKDIELKIAIISGNFVQRGEPSIINKWEKAKMALHAGFDLVLELPTVYAISSAENFANGGVKLASLISSDYLSFGSEIGNIDQLQKLTNMIIENQEIYITKIKEKISEGYSYPKAQELVINDLFENEFDGICTPNNILGLEYLKSISAINSSIIPITIKRNSQEKSSSDIRKLIRQNTNENLSQILPDFSAKIMSENIQNGHIVYSLKCFEKEIFYVLRTISNQDLNQVPDLPENMLNNIKKDADSCNTLEDLISLLKNKSITQARIQRILLYILFGITKRDIQISKEVMPYIRVLGMNDNGKKVISSLSDKATVITSVKKFEDSCQDKKLLRMLEIDKKASDIYTLAYQKDSKAKLDYTTRIITL